MSDDIICEFCKQEFMTSANLQKHLNQEIKCYAPIACPFCAKTFDRKYNYERHLKAKKCVKLKKTNKCSKCLKEYSTATYLKKHMLVCDKSNTEKKNKKEKKEKNTDKQNKDDKDEKNKDEKNKDKNIENENTDSSDEEYEVKPTFNDYNEKLSTFEFDDSFPDFVKKPVYKVVDDNGKEIPVDEIRKINKAAERREKYREKVKNNPKKVKPQENENENTELKQDQDQNPNHDDSLDQYSDKFQENIKDIKETRGSFKKLVENAKKNKDMLQPGEINNLIQSALAEINDKKIPAGFVKVEEYLSPDNNGYPRTERWVKDTDDEIIRTFLSPNYCNIDRNKKIRLHQKDHDDFIRELELVQSNPDILEDIFDRYEKKFDLRSYMQYELLALKQRTEKYKKYYENLPMIKNGFYDFNEEPWDLYLVNFEVFYSGDFVKNLIDLQSFKYPYFCNFKYTDDFYIRRNGVWIGFKDFIKSFKVYLRDKVIKYLGFILAHTNEKHHIQIDRNLKSLLNFTLTPDEENYLIEIGKLNHNYELSNREEINDLINVWKNPKDLFEEKVLIETSKVVENNHKILSTIKSLTK